VAGGRNALLRLPEVRASEFIVILDNDVITPQGHVDRLVSALRSDPGAGVIGPAIQYLPAVAPRIGLKSEEDLLEPIDNQTLARLGRTLLDEVSWFHLGTHPDWFAVYMDEVQLERALIRRVGGAVDPFFAMNHEDPAIRSAVARGSNEPISASNVAGCCQAFRTEVLDEVGYLVDEFSPYGFEDVEFCIRVAKTGKRNYVLPGILMLHGTDRRHAGRRLSDRRIATQRNFMRCKALLAWCHEPGDWEASVEGAILRRYLLARHAGNHRKASEHLQAHLSGALDARRQIRHSDYGRDGP
jgi:GT2 family glycosyltransferase